MTLFDGREGDAQSRVVQEMIDEHLSQPGFLAHVRELMLTYFKADADTQPSLKDQLTPEEYLVHS